MGEPSTEPVGLWLGIQAGAFLGLYFGFSLALVSALTSPEELMRIVYLITIFPLVGGILLGPFLSKRERPVASDIAPIQRTMSALEGMDEGQVLRVNLEYFGRDFPQCVLSCFFI